MILIDLFLLRDTPYRYAAENPRSPIWIPFLLILSGLVYGLLVAVFQRLVGAEIHGIQAREISLSILYGGNILSGIFVAFIFHGGVTLILWLMAKGVGGPGHLALLYRSSAFLLPLGLPAFPYLAADGLSRGVEEIPYSSSFPLLAVFSLALLAGSLFRLYRVSQGVTVLRALLATFMVFFFCTAVLIL
ncbi:MAG: hypothetical protein JXR89_01855 [Deltaproteobacteria bacterium]|nr:hypothetical protein [Deltaproteobacteria bacterium]